MIYQTLKDYLLYVREHGPNGVVPVFKSSVHLIGSGDAHQHVQTYTPEVRLGMPIDESSPTEVNARSAPLKVHLVLDGKLLGKSATVTQKNHLTDKFTAQLR
jgi:hypothetical protein